MICDVIICAFTFFMPSIPVCSIFYQSIKPKRLYDIISLATIQQLYDIWPCSFFCLHFGIVYSSFIENSGVNTWMCPKEGSPWSWIYTVHPGGGSFLRTCFGEEYPVILQISLHPLEIICLNLQYNIVSFYNVSDIFKFWSVCWNLRDALSSECHGLMTEVKHMSIEVSVCNSVRR